MIVIICSVVCILQMHICSTYLAFCCLVFQSLLTWQLWTFAQTNCRAPYYTSWRIRGIRHTQSPNFIYHSYVKHRLLIEKNYIFDKQSKWLEKPQKRMSGMAKKKKKKKKVSWKFIRFLMAVTETRPVKWNWQAKWEWCSRDTVSVMW